MKSPLHRLHVKPAAAARIHRCDRFSKRGYLEVISRHRMRDGGATQGKALIRRHDLHSTEPTSQHCRRSLGEKSSLAQLASNAACWSERYAARGKARKRWLSRRYVTQAESCDRMPGWTIDRARRVSVQSHEGVVSEACV